MKLPISAINDPLYVVAVISNPRRYLSRYDLYRKFAKYVEDSGAILVTVEVAFGDRPFEVTTFGNPFHIQLRTDQELWHKENMVNLGLSRLPADWKYVAWVDADVTFARPDWVQETIQMLQHYDIVQMFSVAQDLSPTHEPFEAHPGIIANWIKSGTPYADYAGLTYACKREGHPGYAWAATRHAMDTVGGVLDTAMMGSGDRHMALGMIGMGEASFQSGVSEGYKTAVRVWCDRVALLKGNIGYVEGLVLHHFHGKKSLRGYNNRWKVLSDNEFNPYTDIMKDTQGLWQLTGNKPRMRHDMRMYFASRNEDDISMD